MLLARLAGTGTWFACQALLVAEGAGWTHRLRVTFVVVEIVPELAGRAVIGG